MKRFEIIPVLLFLMFIAFTPLTKLYNAFIINTYQTTKGKILHSEVVKIKASDSEGGSYYAYKPNIQYEYEVNSIKLTGGQYDHENSHFEKQSEANLIASQYKEQDEVIVFYNPNSPFESLLTKEISPLYYAGFLALIVLLILLAGLCIWNFKKDIKTS